MSSSHLPFINVSNCVSDIDECETSAHLCKGPGAQCLNQPGGYLCTCDTPGYYLAADHLTCVGGYLCFLEILNNLLELASRSFHAFSQRTVNFGTISMP